MANVICLRGLHHPAGLICVANHPRVGDVVDEQAHPAAHRVVRCRCWIGYGHAFWTGVHAMPVVVQDRPSHIRHVLAQLKPLIIGDVADVDFIRRRVLVGFRNDGLARLRHGEDVMGSWDGHRFCEARVLQRLHKELVGLVNELPADRLRRQGKVPGAMMLEDAEPEDATISATEMRLDAAGLSALIAIAAV